MGYFEERLNWCLDRNLCPECDCDYMAITLIDGVCPKCGYICKTHKDIGKDSSLTGDDDGRATKEEFRAALHEVCTDVAEKALRFDLDQAGIAQREKEAVELVELRAEVDRLDNSNKRLKAENEWLKATVDAKEKTLLNYEDAIEELVLENRQLKESE